MAVIFDDAADVLSRTASVPDYNVAYTFSMWVKLTAGGAGDDTLLCISDGTTNNFDAFRVQRSTNFLMVTSTHAAVQSSFVATTNALTNGTWHSVSGRRDDNNTLQITVDGTDVITFDHTVITGRAASTTMAVGALLPSGGNPLEGAIAGLKIWTATFSTAANTANTRSFERFTLMAHSQASLWGCWPFLTGERTMDYSGNGRDWTEGGTLTETSGPPVSWGGQIYIPMAKLLRPPPPLQPYLHMIVR